MTPEKQKAIAWLNDEIRSLRLAPTINGCGMKPEWAEQLEIMQTCLEAVKVCSVDTNKTSPLTLEQLREMDGQPVWMVLKNEPSGCEWMIVYAEQRYLEGKKYIADFREIGHLWLAYAYQPAHIDREAWEPCKLCGGAKYVYGHASAVVPNGDKGQIEKEVEGDFDYCPECGRPLTPEAWAELEKRLRG